MHSLISSVSTFGLLTAHPLPDLAKMHFYFNFGSVSVSIQPGQNILLDNTSTINMELLRSFHAMLFRDLLQTTKPFLVNDHSNKENSFFIVPVLDGRNIDWTTINAFQRLSNCQSVKDENTRMHMRFQPEDYMHKVVSPWYRDDKDSRFVVLNVYTNMSPLSPFPSPEYNTYADYMYDRYKLRTVNQNQFMIEVRGITQKLNRLSSGQYVDGSKKRAFRDREFLIPELCHNYHFPANLWIKATLLPSILHRMHYLLHAEELRLSINQFIGNSLGLTCKPKELDEHWWETTKHSVAFEGSSSAVATVSTQHVESLLTNPWADQIDILNFESTIR